MIHSRRSRACVPGDRISVHPGRNELTTLADTGMVPAGAATLGQRSVTLGRDSAARSLPLRARVIGDGAMRKKLAPWRARPLMLPPMAGRTSGPVPAVGLMVSRQVTLGRPVFAAV